MKKIYISGALFMSQKLADQRSLYEFAESVCQSAGHVCYVPHKHTDPEFMADASPIDVYTTDIEQVRQASAIIAFANEPSFGTGMEIMAAVQCDVPVIVFHQAGVRVSRYLRGYLLRYGYPDVQAYSDQNDLKNQILAWLGEQFAIAA